jgi:uncharacterized membrane protein YgcG
VIEDKNFRDRQVRAKTHQVMDYHYDAAKPGKPLLLLVPGGLIALASLAVIVLIAYHVWMEGSLEQDRGVPLIGLLAPIYIGGVFLFSYGYELYDLPRALRLTAIIVFVTVASVVIIAVLFVVLGGSARSDSSSSRSSRSRSSSGRSTSRTASSGSGGGIGPIFWGGSGTRTVTREVVREVPAKEEKPQPITCPNCGRSYIPAENEYVCPGCGAPAPA